MKKLLLLLLLISPNVFAQTQSTCQILTLDNGAVQQEVGIGTSVTLKWEPSDPINLLYYRIRRSTAVSGTFTVWRTVPPTQNETVIIWAGGDYHYFVTAWYSVNGTPKESTGSNQVRVKTKK